MYKCIHFFAGLNELNIVIKLPIQDEIIAAFLVIVRSNTNSESAINSTAAALKWLHSLVNSKSNPVDSPIVQHIAISGRRNLHKSPVQKAPISLEQVKSSGPDNKLIDLRTARYVSLKYVLLLRHDEMAQIKACHFSELSDGTGISIFIPRSKTNIFRDGSTAVISNTLDKYSPVVILQRYMSECGIRIGQDVFIFTPLSLFSSTKSYKPMADISLSYTRY